MVTTIGVREAIKNLNDLQNKLNLTQTEKDNFFLEWNQELPKITEQEQTAITRIKQRYDYHLFYWKEQLIYWSFSLF